MPGLAKTPELLKAQYQIIRDLYGVYLAQHGGNKDAAERYTVIALQKLGWTIHDAHIGFVRAMD